ncbi:MAG TPA: DNA-directed RNA polymerase subunit omega [Bacteroidales bacterium]|nr:DNA-directed RNA polymerase subunit omega [Bacteroidales bacterium]HRZ77594.1 DNA-directed RNA polymerase subunit omega [Bacteroidales bacterium]
MEYKRIKADNQAVTRRMRDFVNGTDNVYETIVILSKRANQIGMDLKEELNKKISEFTQTSDNLEEVFENKEQIEIAKYYEKLPKPTLLAIQEYLEDQIYFRNPIKEMRDSNP